VDSQADTDVSEKHNACVCSPEDADIMFVPYIGSSPEEGSNMFLRNVGFIVRCFVPLPPSKTVATLEAEPTHYSKQTLRRFQRGK
jgi:hypothetical protein